MEYRLFKETIEALSSGGTYYTIREITERKNEFDISDYMNLFTIPDGKRAREAFLALTKKEVEGILFGIPKIVEVFGASRVIPFIRARYRKYVFRIIYLLWQDYYDNVKFRELFLYVFKHPQTASYTDEVRFSSGTLAELASSPHIENRLSELARKEQLDMREFLARHRISRESVLGIDVMSIFFLFCSGSDYLEFGNERLIIAAERFDVKNQAKMLNNMMNVLAKEEQEVLADVVKYFIAKYGSSASGIVHEFWSHVYPAVRATIQEEYKVHLVT
ncbi:MAG: hypothetical protein ACYC5K_05970 [Saccharofermentanales bacterium]